MASTLTTLDIGLLVGPIIVALAVSALLFGCAFVQTYIYCQLFPRDNRKFRALVAFEMVLQIVHVVLLIQGGADTIINSYPQPELLLTLSVTTVTGIVCGGISVFCAQIFFVFRLYAFSRKTLLSTVCTILALVQFIFTLIVAVSAYNLSNPTPSVQQYSWFITFGLYISIAGDGAIAAGMSYYLRARKTGFERTSRLIDRMVLYIVATGVVTSLTALAAGVSFSVMPNNYVWLALYISESGLYTNSLLAALNSRAHLSNWHDSEVAASTFSLVRRTHTTDAGTQDQERHKDMLEGAQEATGRESDKREAFELPASPPLSGDQHLHMIISSLDS